MSPASGRIRAAPRLHQFIQPARRILRSESRRLVTSKETASLPTKEATNVDADGPQGALKAVRFEKGWTQATLARRLSIRPETVCRWERGKSRPRPTHVRALAYMAARPEAFRLRKEGDVT